MEKQNYIDFRMLFCDDGSTDGTYDLITTQYPEIIALRGTGNLWWAGATNMSIVKALTIGHLEDYIFTLNNDTELVDDSLTSTLDFSKRYQVR